MFLATLPAGRGLVQEAAPSLLLAEAMLPGSSTLQLAPGHWLPSSALCHEELGNESEERPKENGRGSENREGERQRHQDDSATEWKAVELGGRWAAGLTSADTPKGMG